MVKSLYEILEEANNIVSVPERIAFLNNNNSTALQTILTVAYDTNIEWMVPDGQPPYKPAEKSLDDHGQLLNRNIIRKIRMFVRTPEYENMKQIKREQLYIQFLEMINYKDAELVIAARNGKLPFRRIDKRFVVKCFPTLLSDSQNFTEDSNSGGET